MKMQLFDYILKQKNMNVDKKLFTMKYKNKEMKTLLERLPYRELDRINKLIYIDNTKISKQDTIESIISDVDFITNFYINAMSITHYEFIKLLIENDGEILYQEKYIGLLSLFQTYGFCYLVIKNKKKTIIIPNEVIASFKKNLTEMNVYLIEQNTHITKYVRGLINLYGIMELSFVYKKVNEYMPSSIDHSLILGLIKLDTFTDFSFSVDDTYIFSYFIKNYMDKYIEKRNQLTVDYYPYSEDEIIKASEVNNLKNDFMINQYILHYMKELNLPYDKSLDIVLSQLYILKEDIHFELLFSIIKLFKEPNIKQLDYLIAMNENVPKWSLKGYKYHQLNMKNPLNYEKILNLIMSYN